MKTKFPKETITQWSKEILLGLEFLHGHKIVHRDLKPAYGDYFFIKFQFSFI